MVRMNASIAKQGGGASSSPWYTWPVSKHGVTMLSIRSDQPKGQRWMVMTGNPVVWWGALLGMLLAGVGMVAAHARRWHGAAWAADLRGRREAIAFLTVAYLANFAPFALIDRPMYLYHYFGALLFSIMLAAMGVELLTRHAGRAGTPIRVAWIAMLIASGAYLAPIACGWPLSADAVRHRFAVLERRGAE
jgi:dolichyl-phosphate-mannose-protein mannosyltransferase